MAQDSAMEVFDPPRRPAIIVNPAAGGGQGLQKFARVEPALRKHFVGLEVLHTDRSGHACELSRAALERGCDMVIAFGGDGTANEVLCGFVDAQASNRFPEAYLGILAAGTGGDFQRLFGKLSPEKQLSQFLGACPRRIDYGVVDFVDRHGVAQRRPFLNVASVGISGEVARRVNQESTELGPTAKYLKASLTSIVRHRNYPVWVTFEDGTRQRVELSLGAVANGQFFGSGMHVCPQAELSDGHFDVLLTDRLTRVQLMHALSKVFGGRHRRLQGVTIRRAASVQIEPVSSQTRVPIEVDGEQPGFLPGRFHVRAGAIRLVIAGEPKR